MAHCAPKKKRNQKKLGKNKSGPIIIIVNKGEKKPKCGKKRKGIISTHGFRVLGHSPKKKDRWFLVGEFGTIVDTEGVASQHDDRLQ